MNDQALLTYFQEQQPAILTQIEALVTQETPSGDKVRLDAFAAYLADRFRDVGADVTVVPNSERVTMSLPAMVPPSAPVEAKQALILCHLIQFRSVGLLATHPFRVDEAGKAYGPGIFDTVEFGACRVCVAGRGRISTSICPDRLQY
ncbi:MAG: hypothetical protein R2932_53290 [Caldilineaceae bacterium]